MKNNILNIYKEIFKKKKFIKYEIKKIILKSIIQNKNIKPIYRANALYKLSKIDRRTTISKHINICLKSGRNKGTYKLTNFSRHYMRKLFCKNNLQNLKISKW